MEINLLSSKGEELLIFFNGWGMDLNAVKHLAFDEKLAVLEVHDYTGPAVKEVFEPYWHGYRKIHLCAWSLGVRAAAECFSGMKPDFFATATAWNGVLNPIDEKLALPEQVFDQTAENWLSPAVRKKFFFRVFGGDTACLPERSPENQQQELLCIGKRVRQNDTLLSSVFTLAVAGEQDRIFPASGQVGAWNNIGIEVVRMAETGHFPFAKFTRWREVTEYGRLE